MSTIYLSENANKKLQNYLKELGHTLVLIKDTGLVYPEVAAHPDIYMCKLGAEHDSPIFHAETKNPIGYEYPENIKYNAVCMGNYFIHNLKYTSPLLLNKIHQLGFNTINVKQGYTKCNMVVINKHSAITSDEGIYNSVKQYFEIQNISSSLTTSNQNQNNNKNHALNQNKNKINMLLIKTGHVKLGNFSYGFLGGASGRVGNEIIFNGNLKVHPEYEIILEFIKLQNLKVRYFEEYPLEDIGSIIEAP